MTSTSAWRAGPLARRPLSIEFEKLGTRQGKLLGAAAHMEKLAARVPADSSEYQKLIQRAIALRQTADQLQAEITELSARADGDATDAHPR